MGITYVTAVVRNPRRARPSSRVRLLVDSGATYSLLPAKVCRRLHLRATRKVEFDLADGTLIERTVGQAEFTIGGRTAISPVILGTDVDIALLGAVTLETLGLVLNPLTRELTEMRMLINHMRA